MPDETLGLVLAHAEEKLAAGDLQAALLLFELADRLDIFEAPAYKALLRLAEVRCRIGELAAGVRALRDFQCALEVDSGAVDCYVGEETTSAPGEDNPELTEACSERMCGEIFLGYYERPSGETLAWIEEARKRSRQVEELCGVAGDQESGPRPVESPTAPPGAR